MSIAPARIARLTTQGRPWRSENPANLTLVDPSARAVVDRDASLSLSRNNPWHGRELPDPVVATFWGGTADLRARVRPAAIWRTIAADGPVITAHRSVLEGTAGSLTQPAGHGAERARHVPEPAFS